MAAPIPQNFSIRSVSRQEGARVACGQPSDSPALPQDQADIQGRLPSSACLSPTPAVEVTPAVAPSLPAAQASEVPGVLAVEQKPNLPEEVERSLRVLENAPHYRQQVGGEYISSVVPQVPSAFKPWLRGLQPLVAGQAGDAPQTGKDPYHLFGLQLKTLSLAALMAETQAQMARAQGQECSVESLFRQELQHQFDSQAYCQVASPEMLEEIASTPTPPEAQWSGGWFCQQLRDRLGRPPQIEPGPLQRLVDGDPQLVTASASRLEGTAASWTAVVQTTSGYLGHLNDVMGAERNAAEIVTRFTAGTPA